MNNNVDAFCSQILSQNINSDLKVLFKKYILMNNNVDAFCSPILSQKINSDY